ncbi:hypothetical protein Trydic_g9774 [Trypoxylus dichotomus]
MNGTQKKLVAPDGGWGWVIVAAHGLNFFLVFSIFQTFGLIYKNEFVRLGFTGAQSSIIMTTNGGLCMLCGLINGFLLNKFSVRKISFCSATLMVSGLIMTAFSTTFLEFIIAYGIVTSVGIGMGMSSYALAINTYFNKNRSKATAFAITITGIGMILFPQLISFLLANYSIKDTMLIISAVAAHTFVAASLLQPVEWHMKPQETLDENEACTENDKLFQQQNHESGNTNVICDDIATIHASMISLDIDHNHPEQTATFMSIYSIADLCLKFSAPFLSAALKQPSRIMLIGALIGVASIRMFIPFVSNYIVLIALAVSTGAFRGARLVYWQLVLPEYTSVERLASAFGLLFSLNGFLMIVGGPALGAIRDKTGNYTACVILLNSLALLTVLMWVQKFRSVGYRWGHAAETPLKRDGVMEKVLEFNFT